MADDPYRVLGVSPSATENEIKTAYRKLAKKYHPDINHTPDAEARMKEINDAYSQVMKMKKEGTGYTGESRSSGPGYGNPYGGGSQGGGTSWDPFGGFGWDPFGRGGFGGGNHQSYEGETPELAAARRFMQAGEYAQALNALNAVANRTAAWYYLSAQANYGLGNRVEALNHARQAVQMAPGNMEYRQFLNRLEGFGQAYQSQGRQRGFSDIICQNPMLMCCLANTLCNCCCNCNSTGRFGY